MTSLRITLDDQVLLDLPRWDPAHQARFTFAQAVQADGDAVLYLRCTYDDRPADDGYGVEGEMCGAWVYATVDGAE